MAISNQSWAFHMATKHLYAFYFLWHTWYWQDLSMTSQNLHSKQNGLLTWNFLEEYKIFFTKGQIWTFCFSDTILTSPLINRHISLQLYKFLQNNIGCSLVHWLCALYILRELEIKSLMWDIVYGSLKVELASNTCYTEYHSSSLASRWKGGALYMVYDKDNQNPSTTKSKVMK